MWDQLIISKFCCLTKTENLDLGFDLYAKEFCVQKHETIRLKTFSLKNFFKPL